MHKPYSVSPKKIIAKKITHLWTASAFSWDLMYHAVHTSIAPPQPFTAMHFSCVHQNLC